MRLTLDSSDLKPESRDKEDAALNARQVTFNHLTETAQAAVRAVGEGTFYSWGGQNLQCHPFPRVLTQDHSYPASRIPTGGSAFAKKTITISLVFLFS